MLRRNFIRISATAAVIYSKLTYASAAGALVNRPDEAWALLNGNWTKMSASGDSTFTFEGVLVELKSQNDVQTVFVECPAAALEGIRLKWNYKPAAASKILGDHWERSYGDLGWLPPAGLRNPWYVLLNDGKKTAGFGVKTGGDTMCWWTMNPDSLELSMDTLSGGLGVRLRNKQLRAADIITTISKDNETAYATTTRFCKMMCDKPLLPKLPVYGINDWYVVYGKNSAETIRTQTAAMAELVTDTRNRPFSVIDDGWQIPDDFSKANEKFKDMHMVAEQIKALGMRPGLWTRPLIARKNDRSTILAPPILGRNNVRMPILDPTIPENLERITHNVSLYKEWGYELIKHDYSTYDIYGQWGFKMMGGFTQPGWVYYDQSKTNAEIINQLYQTISKAAGDMYVIGCNTMSHLSAGLFAISRIGDDTSGKEWARTKKMGVNTLAFRLPHHNTFYAADGDCVGLTRDVPWEKNRQWLQLLAESGSPLFISAEIDFLGSDQKAAVKQAFAQAAKVQPTGEPLDWMESQWPSKWKLNGRIVDFDWG